MVDKDRGLEWFLQRDPVRFSPASGLPILLPMSLLPPEFEPGPDEPERNSHRLRRFLLTLVVVVVVALIATLALGSLSGSSPTNSNSAVAGSSPSSSATGTGSSSVSMEGCTSAVANADVRVTIYGNGEAACNEWNEGAAKSSGEYWKTKPQGEELQGELVCSMSKGGSLLIEVRDTGEHLRGNQICASLTAKGWHETEGPGAKVEAQQKAEHERIAAAEQSAQNEREAQKRKKEQAQLEKEEAVKMRQEAQEHQKEDHEHEQEAEKQHQELEKQQQEIARENRHNEEETKQAEREAEHGE